MKTFVFVLTILLAAVLVAQQPSGSPSSSPTQATSPQTQSPSQMPAADSSQVESQIQQAWQQQSDLSTAKLNARVSGGAVILSGTVANEDQHQKAVAAATQSAGGMKVVDKIKVQAQ